MIKILPLNKNDATFIVDWNKGTTADFLVQWAGRGYEFPITELQIIRRIDEESSSNYKLYKILLDETIIGTIELMNIDEEKKRADFGRFLLNPSLVGNGYGTSALKEFVRKVFNEFEINVLGLTVFDFNKSALRCYEKTGFKIINKQTRPNGWIAIRMEITNSTK